MKMATKFAKVYDYAAVGVAQGIILNETELNALATWLCHRSCRDNLNAQRDSQIKSHGGYCNECEREAGFLLYACPYIDMSRPADAAPEMQPEEADAA
jgi:hypothetical protein